MKDIDFDELDRAVSSVLRKDTTKPETVTADVVETEATPSGPTVSPASVAESVPVSPVVPNASADVASPSTTSVSDIDTSNESTLEESNIATPTRSSSPIALKPRGKFMDVMHPSSDMNPGIATAVPPVRSAPITLSPSASALTPSASELPSEHNDSSTSDEESKIAIAAEQAPTPDTVALDHLLAQSFESTAKESDASLDQLPGSKTDGYVDPLDLPLKPKPESPSADLEVDTSPETVEPVEQPVEVTQPAQTPTPFLSDTKVDKRPLGGFVDQEQKDTTPPASPEVDNQAAPVVPLPRELQSDIVQVESIQETDQQSATGQEPDKPFATNLATPTVDNDGRVEGHPLFDTATYHEPIVPAHGKRKVPWVWWLSGLGGCLVVGAGVGYFLFMAGL